MKNKISIITKIAVALLLIMGIVDIILSFISLKSPVDTSEFGILHNLAMGIYAILIIVISLIMIFSAIFLFKQKRWAFFYV